MNHPNDRKSMLMFLSSMVIFGTVGIFRRHILLPSEWIAFFRGLFGAFTLILLIKLKGTKLNFHIPSNSMILLLISGAVMGVNWILLFEAYNHTTVAIATLCFYMQPAIVILLSPIVFGEKLTVKKLVSAGIAIIGITLVSGIFSPEDVQGSNQIGIYFGLSAAFLYATVVMMNKKIQNVPANEKTILQLFSAAITLIPYLVFTAKNVSVNTVDAKSIVLLLIISVFHTGLAYAVYFYSIQGLKTQTIALFSYIDPVSALFFSSVFLGESLRFLGVIGAILIIGAAIFSELGKTT